LQQLCNIIKAIGKLTLIYNFKTLFFSESISWEKLIIIRNIVYIDSKIGPKVTNRI